MQPNFIITVWTNPFVTQICKTDLVVIQWILHWAVFGSFSYLCLYDWDFGKLARLPRVFLSVSMRKFLNPQNDKYHEHRRFWPPWWYCTSCVPEICCSVLGRRFGGAPDVLDHNHVFTSLRAREAKWPPWRSGPAKRPAFTCWARTYRSSRSLSSCCLSRGAAVKSHNWASKSRSRDRYPKLELPISVILGPSSSPGRLHHSPLAWNVHPSLSYS